ncbi:MAG: hypothetical protein RL090_478, partial [Bacteroidota bacterium]
GISGKLIYKSNHYEILDEETNWIKEINEERTIPWVTGTSLPDYFLKPQDDY